MKVWSDTGPKMKSARAVKVWFDKLEVPENFYEWLAHRKADKKLRGSNLVHKIVEDDGYMSIVFGSGTLNQTGTATEQWLEKRLIKILRELRDEHLKPDRVSVWAATRLLKNEKMSHRLLALTSTREQRMTAYKDLRRKVRHFDKESQEFVLRVNSQITRLQKAVENGDQSWKGV